MRDLNQYFSNAPVPLAVLGVLLCAIIIWFILQFIIQNLIVKNLMREIPLPLMRRKAVSSVARVVMNPKRREQRAKTIGSLLSSFSSLIIAVFIIWFLAVALDLSLAPLLASVSIAGVAIGFGTQQLIRDFISGIFITIEDQIGIGDYIQVGDVKGTVLRVNLRTTELVDDDGVIWYLRNGEMMQIGNHSQKETHGK
ncbi:MAG: mechanosensitive ion channel [Micrococcaceae bacterium]